jgi:filamentous hemagglutinin
MQDYLRNANVDPDSAQGRLLMGSAAVGAAVGGSSGAATALAGEQFNRQLHVDEAVKLAALKEGKSEQEQQRLNDAMCALARCSVGVPDDDPNKANLIASEQRGQSYASEQRLIQEARAFNGYSSLDAFNDSLLRRDEAIGRTKGVVQAIGGAAGAVGATVGAVASTPACVSVAGCVAPVGLSALAVLSAKDGLDGLDKALAPYQSYQGERVLDSFDPRTHWGEQNPLADLGVSTATLAAEMVIAKVGGKATSFEVGASPGRAGKRPLDSAGGPEEPAPKVTAEGTVDGQTFTDVNQTARPASQAKADQPTLIAARVNEKIESSGRPLPNATMATAHAEIGVIQQAFNAGKTQGAAMAIEVTGEPVCGYCRGDIAAAADKAGLKSLEINEVATGKTLYWRPGMRSIRELD